MNIKKSIILSGKDILHKPSKKCPHSQIESIILLANFVFFQPSFFSVITDIFKYCYDKDSYVKSFSDLIDLNKNDYAIGDFQIFYELITTFYKNSQDISNDRGLFLEELCSLASKTKINIDPNTLTKYHCFVSVKINHYSLSTSPHNIDVCFQYLESGEYLESKVGLNSDDKKLNKKIQKLSKIKKIFNKHFDSHEVYIVTLTNDPRKLGHYKKVWPDMDFMSVNEFKSRYCISRSN